MTSRGWNICRETSITSTPAATPVRARTPELPRLRLRAIIDRVELGEKLGVCLDTCHVSDAGYDVAGNLDGVLAEFDRVIGLARLRAVHLNDSLNPCGAHKDRHARIGEGTLGQETFCRIINHPALRNLPFVLETPNELDGYAREIALLRGMREGDA